MEDLSKTYQKYREIKGQFTGGQYNEEVDSKDGIKFKAMDQILKELSPSGTSVEKVYNTLGQPDNMVSELPNANSANTLPTMPGIVLPTGSGSNNNSVYMLYYWRGVHDYLWFKLNEDESKVVEANWKFN